MEPKKIRVLLFEDNEDDVLILRHMLHKSRAASFELEPVDTLAGGMERLKKDGIDVVLLDLSLPDSRGLETFYTVHKDNPGVPIIVLSGLDDETVALEAVHAGAQDYLVKGHADAQLLTRALIYSIERTQSRIALQTAEEKFRSIFENSVEGIFQTTPDGHYISANPALVRIYGYDSPQQLIANMTDIQHQLYVDPNRRNDFIRIMQEKGLVTDFESQIYRRDKSIIWISENARAVRDERGKLLYYEGMVEDITARKRAEDEVRFSEKRFRSVWENALDGMRLTDANGIILAVNPSFCRIVGMQRDELEGKPFTVIYSDNENPEEMLLKYRERFTHRTIESQLERHVIFKSGKAVDLEVYNSYIEMDRDTLVLGVFHDITTRKHAEEREREATRELAASQAELRIKNEMLEDDLKMAHEIQQAILPQQYPTFPKGVPQEQSLLRFAHRYQPSGEVGGDFFNVLPISSTKAGVFICDVMGHGVRSALVTAMVRALVEELRTIGHDPGLLLMRLNSDLRAILQQTGTPLFTTAFYLVADLETRQISYANAGHPKPFIIYADSRHVELLKNPSQKASPALGLFADSTYPTAQRSFEPGDRILFYTDGLYEVEGPDGTQYTQEMLQDAVRQNAPKTENAFLDGLLSQITNFSENQKFADDVCLVTLEVAKVETR